MGKSAQDIYATALTILQVGQLTIRLPPNPDFNSLSPEEKYWIYQDLSRGDTGPALESGLAIQEFVVSFVCRFQVILSHGYINFPTIDDLWQILLDRYLKIGLESCDRVPLLLRTVEEGSSWEGSRPIQLPYIPQDSTIANNYRQNRNSAGIEMDSMRNPPRPAKQSRIQSDSNSLFGKDSGLSEGSEDI
jgi:hypothetical protein